jgi:hypothetical protein
VSGTRLAGLALVFAAAAVAIAWIVSVTRDRLFPPIVNDLGDEPLSVVFLHLPAAATIVVGCRFRRPARARASG